MDEQHYSRIVANETLASNQHTAFYHILILLLGFTIPNLVINYTNVKLYHIVIFVLLCIYTFSHKSVSRFFIPYLKSSIRDVETANKSDILIVHMKLLFLCGVIISLPLSIFVMMHNIEFLPQSLSTDISSVYDDASSSVNSNIDNIKMTAETGNNAVNEFASNIVERANDLQQNVADRVNTMTQNNIS
tara:strand:- start:534 stop:1100 length:567 start_codon:yes stop_codon:yes gene_type:complete